jgi:hypothetical protein
MVARLLVEESLPAQAIGKFHEKLPSGKRLQFANWKITIFKNGKATINGAIFNSFF